MSTATLEPTPMPKLPPELTGPNLADRTALIRVSFGLLGNTRKVSGSQVEVDADKTMIRVNKTLLDSPELEAIRKADGAIRTWLYNLVCLNTDSGVYIVSLDSIPKILKRLKEYEKVGRPKLIRDFVRAYPELCAKSAERLRTLYNPGDYLEQEDIEAAFTFSWRFLSFGAPDSLKVISRAVWQEEKEKAAQELEAAWTEIRATMRATMAELVSHLKERLDSDKDGKPKVFKETTVKNLLEFIDNFSLRNVTDDRELAEEVKKAKSLLNGIDAAKLRESDNLRSYVKKEMTQISDTLGKLVTYKPTRKIRDYAV